MGTKGCFLLFGILCFAFDTTAAPPQELWRYISPDKALQGPPAVARDGTVYVTTEDTLTALNAEGQVKWRLAGVRRPICVADDGTVYCRERLPAPIDSQYGSALAVSTAGTVKWRYPGTVHFWAEVTAISADGHLYVNEGLRDPTAGGSTNWLSALDATGKPIWRLRYPSAVQCIAPSGTLMTGSEAIAPDGSRRWPISLGSPIRALAVALDGSIAGTLASPVSVPVVLTEHGALRWQGPVVDGGGRAERTPAAFGLDGRLFTLGNTVRAFDRWGNLEWEFYTDSDQGFRWASLVAASDGTIFAGGKAVHWLGSNGAPLWSSDPDPFYPAESARLVLDDMGRLYATQRKNLTVWQTRAGPANSGWPMPGADAAQTARAANRPARAMFSDMRWIHTRGFFATLTADVGTLYDVLTSTNLVEWEVVGSFTHTNQVAELFDPETSGFAQRYFKLRER